MIKIRHENLLITFVTLSLLIAIFLVIDPQLVSADPAYPDFEFICVDSNIDRNNSDKAKTWNEEWNGTIEWRYWGAPGCQFKWINDGGGTFLNDGELPAIPAVASAPIAIQFQIIGDDHSYFGAINQQMAMENITISGNALFTGTLDKIPEVSFTNGTTWNVPIIPTMSQGGGEINIVAYWKNYGYIKEILSIGGTNYLFNGTIVSVTPNKFEFGTNQTFTIEVKYADGSTISSAAVYLYYIGDDDGGTAGDPIESHVISYDWNGFDGYTIKFNTTQQTVNQTIAGFTSIRERRNLTVYSSAWVGATPVYGYAKIEMIPQVPKPELEVEIKRGIDRKVTVFIRNNGEANATNVKYNITVKGVIFNFINKSVEDIIPLLEMNKETHIDVSVFGLGFLYINAIVDTINKGMVGLVFLNFVYIP